MRKIGLVAACALTALSATSNVAQEVTTPGAPINVIKVRPGFTVVLRSPRAIDRMTIGEPEIADVNPQTDRTFTLFGKKPGKTQLRLFDPTGENFYTAIVSVATDDLPSEPRQAPPARQ
jgi:pilus assembly protein CpaC